MVAFFVIARPEMCMHIVSIPPINNNNIY